MAAPTSSPVVRGVYAELDCAGTELHAGDIVLTIDTRPAVGQVIDDHGHLSIGSWPTARTGPGLTVEEDGRYTVLRMVAHGRDALACLNDYVAAHGQYPCQHSGTPCSEDFSFGELSFGELSFGELSFGHG